jgi:hypothetical protein
MAQRSPIAYADRVRTPTIVLAGHHDTRCPFEQAMTWVEAVRAAGGEVEVYEYDTGHISFDVDEVVRQMRAILDFLSRHVPRPLTPCLHRHGTPLRVGRPGGPGRHRPVRPRSVPPPDRGMGRDRR